MTDALHCDIAIIGAGIAGSALAAALSGHGLSIALVEAQPPAPLAPPVDGVDGFDARVSAITPRSRQLLEQLGAWEAIAAYRQCPYHHMTVWDAEGTGRIDFDRREVAADALGYIVENRAIVSALLQRIAACADISLFCPAALTALQRGADERLHVVLADGRRVVAELLVAADGAQSRVRDMLGFATRDWAYGQRALVTTVALEHPHADTAWQRFLPSGPLALLPLPSAGEGSYCSIVWSLQDARAAEVLALDDATFCTTLGQASEHCLGRVTACAPRQAFPLSQRHAIDYVQPGVALVADAAHTIHPLAGQGINLGLQDVRVLAEEILAGRTRGVPPGQLQLLRRYQRRRKGENLAMMAAMEAFKRLFEQDALPLRWLRNTGLSGVNRLAPLKRELMLRAMGVH